MPRSLRRPADHVAWSAWLTLRSGFHPSAVPGHSNSARGLGTHVPRSAARKYRSAAAAGLLAGPVPSLFTHRYRERARHPVDQPADQELVTPEGFTLLLPGHALITYSVTTELPIDVDVGGTSSRPRLLRGTALTPLACGHSYRRRHG
jgi:hypothetical protein